MRQWSFLVVYPIDYRCYNRRFCLSAHNFSKRSLKTSPNPNFSKLETRKANSDFWSWITHRLLGGLKSTIPNLQIYLPKKANSEKLGLGRDNPCRIVFFFEFADEQVLERVNDRHIWNPGVISYAMIPCRPDSRVFLNGSSVLPYITRSTPGLGTHLGQVTGFRG